MWAPAGDGEITYSELYASLQARRAYKSELLANQDPIPPMPLLPRTLQHRKAELLELHRQYEQVRNC